LEKNKKTIEENRAVQCYEFACWWDKYRAGESLPHYRLYEIPAAVVREWMGTKEYKRVAQKRKPKAE